MAIAIVEARFQNPPQTATDSFNVKWTISLMGQVKFNGAVDTNTSGVTKLALVGSNVWHLNTAGSWFSKPVVQTPVAGGWGAGSNPIPAGQAVRIYDVVGTFGFNTESNFPGSPDGPTHMAAMNFLSAGTNAFKKFRSFCAVPGFETDAVTQFCAAGLKGSFIVTNKGVADTSQVAPNVAAQIGFTGAASIFAFEGPNEPGDGSLSSTTCQDMAAALGSTIASRSDCAGIIPALPFSSWLGPPGMSQTLGFQNSVGDLTSRGINWGNWHGYVNDGSNHCVQPWGAINGPNDALANTAITCPNRPFCITEFGINIPGSTQSYEQSTAAAGGKMMLNYFLDAYYLGCAGTFIFCLFDEVAETFNLFDFSANPTPCATVLRNFSVICADPGASPASFLPDVLSVSVTGLPTTGPNAGRYVIAQRSDGKFLVILWNEPPVQNASVQDVSPTPTTVTLSFGQPIASATRYDPTVGQSSVQNYGSIASGGFLTASLTGYPQVILVSPAGSFTPSPNNTIVTAGSGGSITDQNGNIWTITSGGQVAVNGIADTTTSGVIELAYENGLIWQENGANLWWSKSVPADAWSPPAGTTTSPIPSGPPSVAISYQPQYRLHGSSSWQNFGSPITVRTVTVTGLQPASSYDFLVFATDIYGSTPSNIKTDSTTTVSSTTGDSVGVTASRIADFMEKFGVNTFSAPDATSNPWGSLPADYTTGTVIAALNWLTAGSGLTMNVRENHYASSTWQPTWCPTVASATGARFSIAIGSGGATTDVASLISMASSSSNGTGWLKWLEGLNEPNTDFGAGTVPEATALSIQQNIWSSAQPLNTNPFPVTIAGPSIAVGTPNPENSVFAYINNPDLTTLIANESVSNVHIYPVSQCDMDDGSGRNGLMNDYAQGMVVAYPGKSTLVTEWHPTLFNIEGHVLDPAYDAYYAPMFCLSAFRAGFLGWFWYSLFDFATFNLTGLFPQNATNPRPVANVIRAMYSLTGDSGTGKRTFIPGKLDYTIGNLPAPLAGAPNTGGQSMLFQSSAGKFFLWIWNAQVDPGGSPVQVRITFNSRPMTSVTEYDLTTNPAANTTPVQTLNSVQSMTISLTASVHLLVIQY